MTSSAFFSSSIDRMKSRLKKMESWSYIEAIRSLTPGHLLIISCLCLVVLGFVMIASASMPYAARSFHSPFYFLQRDLIYILMAAAGGLIVYRVPMKVWFQQTFLILLAVLVLLVLVLVAGNSINGSKRWISLLGFTFQPSELAKFAMILFTSDYVVRRAEEVKASWSGFFRLGIPMGLVVFLVMLEPDLGATVVIVASVMSIFFLAGAPLKQFIVLFLVALGGLIMAILFEPYRLKRLTSFTNPWDDEYGTDYQLKQSLIAFGRGEWFGTGLGHSVQKLSYLPEAHTDFLLAIIAEELGFIGIICLLFLLFLLISSAMRIGYNALSKSHIRSGYLAYGIATIFLLQTLVNAGMNMGILPTKGLTLPFISYGGTSLLTFAAMVAILMRIDYETRTVSAREAP